MLTKSNSASRYGWLILAVVAIAGGAFFLLPSKPPSAQPEASAPPGMFQATDKEWGNLKFAAAQKKLLHAGIAAEGKIASNDDSTTPVYSPYTGRVTQLFAEEGGQVERGDPLMAVAAPDYSNARAQLKLATENEKRQHALYEAKTGTLKDWEQAQADLQTAQGNFRAAGLEQSALHDRLRAQGKSDAEIDALESDAIVTAPIGGTVLQRQVGLGQYLNSAAGGASSPAFTISDLSTVWLLADVHESDASLMKVGEEAEVHVLAYPGRTFKAKLTYVAPAIDPATRRLPVRAEIDNSENELKPEMFATFSIATGEEVEGTVIPEEAIIYEGADAHVWVARKDHKWIGLRPIRVGRNDNGQVEVLKGLEAGERVVTSGSLFIDRAAKGDNQDAADKAP